MILALFKEPCRTDGKEIAVKTSVGSTRFPQDACESGVLVHCADEALYHVKRNGKHEGLTWRRLQEIRTPEQNVCNKMSSNQDSLGQASNKEI